MCYAIPARIIQRDGDKALVDYGGVLKSVNLCLLGSAGIGDYVLVHAGFAIERIDDKSAEESLRIINESISEFDKADHGRQNFGRKTP
jgi:hydrogenase expression/formation protein HypC